MSNETNEIVLSVIVPSYNMERYLPACLDSMAGVEGLEILVVNDGSTDLTSAIAHRYAAEDSRIQVIDKSNAHYGSCVNAGLAAAHGQFVKILDADDTFQTDNLKAFVGFLRNHRDADVVFTDYKMVDERGAEIRTNRWELPREQELSFDQIANYYPPVFMHGLTYKMANLRRIDYHQLEGVCYTDTEWCFMPMAEVRHAWYLPITIYQYLIGRQGQSADMAEVAKNRWMYVSVLKDMCAQYEARLSSLSDVQKQYLKRRINQLLVILYQFALRAKNRRKAFDAFDQELLAISRTAYDFASEIVLSRRMGVRYVKIFRAAGILRGGVLWCVAIYPRLLQIVRSLHR